MAKKKISIVPLGNRVLVKPLEAETVTASGIVIPDTASQEKPEQGEVVAVGDGCACCVGKENGTCSCSHDDDCCAPQVKVGDTVVFSKYGYDEIKHDGDDYFIIKGSNILAVLK